MKTFAERFRRCYQLLAECRKQDSAAKASLLRLWADAIDKYAQN
jgi:hypothetical protein